MHPEPDRLGDDDTYELDRKAWNLPRPRPRLTIAPLLEASNDDGSHEESYTDESAEQRG
jgi:hypothetical protein